MITSKSLFVSSSWSLFYLLLNLSAAKGEDRLCFRSASSTQRIALGQIVSCKKECHMVQVVNNKHFWYEEGLRQYRQTGKAVRKGRKVKGEMIPVHVRKAYRASTDAE